MSATNSDKSASVNGQFTISSGNTTYVSVSPATGSSNVSNQHVDLTYGGTSNATSVILTVGFTPSDTNNYNTVSSSTLTLYLKSSLIYYYDGTSIASTRSYCGNKTDAACSLYVDDVIKTSFTESTGTNCAGFNVKSGFDYVGLATTVNSSTFTITTTYSSSNSIYYAVYSGVYVAYFKKGTGISAIGSSNLSCSNYKLAASTSSYTTSACTSTITLPSITADDGYESKGWFEGYYYDSLTSTSGTAPGTAITLNSTSCYTARADVSIIYAVDLIYDGDYSSATSCTESQCMIDRLDDLIE